MPKWKRHLSVTVRRSVRAAQAGRILYVSDTFTTHLIPKQRRMKAPVDSWTPWNQIFCGPTWFFLHGVPHLHWNSLRLLAFERSKFSPQLVLPPQWLCPLAPKDTAMPWVSTGIYTLGLLKCTLPSCRQNFCRLLTLNWMWWRLVCTSLSYYFRLSADSGRCCDSYIQFIFFNLHLDTTYPWRFLPFLNESHHMTQGSKPSMTYSRPGTAEQNCF